MLHGRTLPGTILFGSYATPGFHALTPLRNERSYKWAVPKGTFLLRVEEVFEQLSIEDDPISRIGDFLLTMPSIHPVLPSDAGVGSATVLQERAADLEQVFGSCLGWMAPGVSLRKLPHYQLETNPVRVAARIFHLMARYIATAATAETGDISLKTKATQECSTWLGEGHCVEAGRSGIWDLRQKSPQN